MLSTENHFWAFSLTAYAKPHVADCCLQLQDHYDADVNLLLWSIWLEQQQIRLTDARLAMALELIQRWNTDYVQALRNLRRAMKREFAQDLERVAVVRDNIKQAELAAEKQEQQWLESLAQGWNVEAIEILAGENLQVYLDYLKIPLAIIEQVETNIW